MRTRIFPYKMGSRSAKDVSRSLGVLRVHGDKKYRPRLGDVIINWGNSQAPTWKTDNVVFINKPEAVKIATNKLLTFDTLKKANVRIPTYSVDCHDALHWPKIAIRNVVDGSCGIGIDVVDDDTLKQRMYSQNFTSAPLYVKYIETQAEYRVHVFRGEVIDYVKKAKLGTEPSADNVRNFKSGWAFVRKNLVPRESIKKLAVDAITALGLDFGAVDIVLGTDGISYVLEINTAPGLSPMGIEAYKNAIIKLTETEHGHI